MNRIRMGLERVKWQIFVKSVTNSKASQTWNLLSGRGILPFLITILSTELVDGRKIRLPQCPA
jgi:hypothetical protein